MASASAMVSAMMVSNMRIFYGIVIYILIGLVVLKQLGYFDALLIFIDECTEQCHIEVLPENWQVFVKYGSFLLGVIVGCIRYPIDIVKCIFMENDKGDNP